MDMRFLLRKQKGTHRQTVRLLQQKCHKLHQSITPFRKADQFAQEDRFIGRNLICCTKFCRTRKVEPVPAWCLQEMRGRGCRNSKKNESDIMERADFMFSLLVWI